MAGTFPGYSGVQPVTPRRINTANPLTKGLVDVMVPHLGQSSVLGIMPARTGTTQVIRGRAGMQALVEATEGSVDKWTYTGAATRINVLTALCVYRQPAAQSTSRRIAGNFAASTNGWTFGVTATNFTWLSSRAAVNSTLTGAATTTGLRVAVATIDATNQTLFEQGVLTAGPTAHGGVTAPTGSFTIGADNGGSGSANCEVYLCVVWNRVLSNNEITEISRNPWQLFQAPDTEFWNASAGSNNTLAAPLGTLTLTGLVPTLTQGNSLTAPLGTLTLTGLVPTITQGNSVAAPLGTMTLTGLVPTFDQAGNNTLTAPLGTLTLQGLVPTFAQSVTITTTRSQGGGRGRKEPSYEDWQAYVELREAYQQLSVAVEPEKPKQKAVAKAVQRVNVAAKAVAQDLPGLPSLDEVRINIRAAQSGLIELRNYIAAAEAAKAEQDDEEVMLAITLH